MKQLLGKIEKHSHKVVAFAMAIVLTITGLGISSNAGVIQERDKTGQQATLSYDKKTDGQSSWNSIIGTTAYGHFKLHMGSDSCSCFCIDPGTNIKRGCGGETQFHHR